jgi:hypothetical protein
MKHGVVLPIGLALLALQGCSSNRIQVPVEDSPNSALVWRDKLDPEVFAEKTKTLRLSLDATVVRGVRVGPAVEFGNKAVQQWNDNVATVNTMYRALANDWNAGLLSLARFNKKRDEIDALYERLADEKKVLQSDKDAAEQQRLVDSCRELTETKSQELTGK